MQAGEHGPASHIHCRGILTVKQRGAIKRAVRAAPMTVGAQVHTNLKNFSPGKQVPFDERSRKAVARLARRERAMVMEETIPGIKFDGSEGSMNELAESLSLVKFIEQHNDPNDSFHLDEHQVVCLGHQFDKGVWFAAFSTPHLLKNMARAKNCQWQEQGHTNGAFNSSTGEGRKLL